MRHIEVSYREYVCNRLLGIDPLYHRIMCSFIGGGPEWSAKALSNYLREPRATILRRLQRLEGSAILCHSPDGWGFTKGGAALVGSGVLETIQVVRGSRAGFSRGFIDNWKKAGFSVQDEALRVRFPRL